MAKKKTKRKVTPDDEVNPFDAQVLASDPGGGEEIQLQMLEEQKQTNQLLERIETAIITSGARLG